MIKALFFDIDGTLVSFNTHTIPASTIEALERVHQKGIKIFIATGRPTQIMNNLGELQKRNLIDGYITMNGAYCYIGDKTIYKSAISEKDVEMLGKICEEKKYACIFVGEKDVAICNANDIVQKIFVDFLKVSLPTSLYTSTEKAVQLPAYQITPFFTAEQETEVKPFIENCEFGRWHPAFTDITAIGNTKQNGIDKILAECNLKLEETMAFGDGGNDMGMLKHAAIGVAMGNASDAVKACANYVTTTVDEDGIKNALEHFNLI